MLARELQQDRLLDGLQQTGDLGRQEARAAGCGLEIGDERILDRLQAWKQAGSKGHVGSMLIGGGQPELLQLLAEEIL